MLLLLLLLLLFLLEGLLDEELDLEVVVDRTDILDGKLFLHL